jgi:outer membrane protein assembly factor BamA
MAKAFSLFLVCFLLFHATGAIAQEALVIADDELYILDIQITGNKVTHESVILRELVVAEGDTLLKMELIPSLQRSRENLLKLAIFNFVYLNVKHLGNNQIILIIDVTERWYIWPIPILEYADRNFSTFVKNWDWDKINYGAWLRWSNFRGRNELLTAKVRLGYIKEYSLAYSKPNLGKRQNHGISFGFNANQQDEVSVSTVNNMPNEYKPDKVPAQTRLNAFISYTYRPKFYSTHSLRFEYFDYLVSDSVAIVNSNYLGQGDTQLDFTRLSYVFEYDIRDSKVYPLEGFNVKIKAEQTGLGLVKDFDYPTFNLTGILMYHQKLTSWLYFYNTTKARYSSEKTMPHVLNKALGYNEYLSAYEPYVIDGSDYVITYYNIKFQVVKPSTYTIPFVGMEQFNKIHYAVYVNVFADAGYVRNDFPNPTNTMVNKWQFSAGIGLDLVTYYDKVFRIDYSINRYGEHGVFLHIETPFYRW